MADTLKYNVATDVITKSTLLPALRSTGLNQSELARLFGTTQGAINHWLTGIREPSAMAIKLAQYVLAQPREIGVGLPTISGGFAGNRRDKPIYDGPKRKRGRPKLSK